MRNKIWALTLFALCLAVPSVMAAVVTPTCTFTGYTPASMTQTENTTLMVTVESGLMNMSNATISIVPHNGTSGGVFTSTTANSAYNATAIWTALPDQTYTISATLEYNNNSALSEYKNLSTMSVDCTDRQFTINTQTSSIVPGLQQQEQQAQATKSSNTSVIVLVIIVIAAVLLISKKK